MFLARLNSAKNAAGGFTMKASTLFSLPTCPNNRGRLFQEPDQDGVE